MTAEFFSVRVMELQKTLYHVAYGMLYNSHDCADAVQECILKAWRMRDSLKSEDSLRPWMIRILINECNNMLRTKKRCMPMEELPEMKAPPDADPWLHDAIGALPEKLRLPVVLYYMEGFTVEETASILHIPKGTVKTRLSSARKELRTALQDVDGRAAYERV